MGIILGRSEFLQADYQCFSKLHAMIPDHIVFGINQNKEGIFYKDIRQVKDDQELIQLLKLRLDTFFIGQVAPMEQYHSAFPLAIMACIGIETLGQVFIGSGENMGDSFVNMTKQIHQFFGRRPSLKFEAGFKQSWPEKDWEQVDCYGKLFYVYFRNSMVHGYQGKAIFLSYEDTENFQINEEFGYLVINPNWIWKLMEKKYEELFRKALIGQDTNRSRRQCLHYIKKLIS